MSKPVAEPDHDPVPNFTALFADKLRASTLRERLKAWDGPAEAARVKLCQRLTKWADNHPNNQHAAGLMREAEAALTLLGDLVAKVKEQGRP